MFVIVGLCVIFHTEYIGIFVIIFHTNFHVPCSNLSTVIAIKQKTKYRIHAAAMLLIYILIRKTFTKLHILLRCITTHHLSPLS
jgi:uncharacterized membrane protein YobD (UPF0266 family)